MAEPLPITAQALLFHSNLSLLLASTTSFISLCSALSLLAFSIRSTLIASYSALASLINPEFSFDSLSLRAALPCVSATSSGTRSWGGREGRTRLVYQNYLG